MLTKRRHWKKIPYINAEDKTNDGVDAAEFTAAIDAIADKDFEDAGKTKPAVSFVETFWYADANHGGDLDAAEQKAAGLFGCDDANLDFLEAHNCLITKAETTVHVDGTLTAADFLSLTGPVGKPFAVGVGKIADILLIILRVESETKKANADGELSFGELKGALEGQQPKISEADFAKIGGAELSPVEILIAMADATKKASVSNLFTDLFNAIDDPPASGEPADGKISSTEMSKHAVGADLIAALVELHGKIDDIGNKDGSVELGEFNTYFGVA